MFAGKEKKKKKQKERNSRKGTTDKETTFTCTYFELCDPNKFWYDSSERVTA